MSDWQIEQGKRCGCKGSDEWCGCQNNAPITHPWPMPDEIIAWPSNVTPGGEIALTGAWSARRHYTDEAVRYRRAPPTVTPLTFRTVADGRMALSPVGPYSILEQPDGHFDVMFDGCLVNKRKNGEAFTNYETAEAWTQARHNRQVLSCLSTHHLKEPNP